MAKKTSKSFILVADGADDGSVYGVGDAYQQARNCILLIEKTLNDLGANLTHVMRTRIFVTDIRLWEDFGRAHHDFFSEYPPATSMIEVNRLIHPDMLIEIEADALIDE